MPVNLLFDIFIAVKEDKRDQQLIHNTVNQLFTCTLFNILVGQKMTALLKMKMLW